MNSAPDNSTAAPSTNAAEFHSESDDVFSRIAGRYDRLSDVFSLLAHRYWKSTMARQIAADAGSEILDVASGTGDIALRVASRLGTGSKRVIAGDLCPAMLALARRKADARALPVEFMVLDAHNLIEFPDGSVDVYAISFAMKICDRSRVLREAFRVLRPGGRFFCLEASRIPVPFIHSLYLRYMDWCLPLIARIATGGDRSSYDYLLRGIHDFPSAPVLAQEIESYGFATASYRYMTGGIVALHVGVKPS